jgi:hypothetical protein
MGTRAASSVDERRKNSLNMLRPCVAHTRRVHFRGYEVWSMMVAYTQVPESSHWLALAAVGIQFQHT